MGTSKSPPKKTWLFSRSSSFGCLTYSQFIVLQLYHAEAEEPPQQQGRRGKSKCSVGRNLLNRLKKHEEGVLVFALEEDVPFTNNQAKRDLRPAKVKQKVSGCFRTETGAEVYARLQAVVSTFRKLGLKVFTSLRELFSYKPIIVC